MKATDSGDERQMTSMAALDVVVTHSNASGGGLWAGGGAADHNVAIVITLVAVTLALALAVMATICIIRRWVLGFYFIFIFFTILS